MLRVFNSDSCNGMKAVRKELVYGEAKIFDDEYGCSPHCFNNFSKDFLGFEKPSYFLKLAMVQVKYVRGNRVVKLLFLKECKKEGLIFTVLLLFSESRWSSSNYMFV